jgi:glutamyl-tRNA reductase
VNIIAVGMSYHTADPGLLERVAVPAAELPAILADLLVCDEIGEAVVLSTDDRTEIYAAAETFHGGLDEVVAVLSSHSGVEAEVLHRHLYVHHAEGAVEHLFTVAAGLDSVVRGEKRILGQLRTAYCTARNSGSAGRLMHDLSQRALRVGKRVHAATGPPRSGASVVSEALADYVAAQRSAAVSPTVTALRRRAAEVVDSELLRLDSRLAELDPLVRNELAGTVRRVVDKLLHAPTVQVKASGADYAAMLCELFELPPEAGQAA